MKYRILFLFFLAWQMAQAEEVSLLANPGFEEGLTGWTVPSTGAETAKVLPEAASIGGKGLRVQSAPGGAKYEILSSKIPVVPGRTFTVSFWGGRGDGSSGRGVTVEMLFQGKTGEALKPVMASIRKWPAIEVRSGKYFGDFLLAAAAPENASTLAICIKSPASGSVDLDDFIVRELKPADSPATPTPAPGTGHAVPTTEPALINALLEEIKSNPYRGQAPPKIVVKLDDLKPFNGGVHPRWQKIVDFAKAHGIKINLGIIAQSMEADAPKFFQWVKDRHASGEIEFWNHGYDHAELPPQDGKRITEFLGTPYEHQKKHFSDAQRLAREKLGFAFESFGAPFNTTDATTAKVLSEEPEIKVWLYGDPANPAGKTVLERSVVSIESPTLIANYGAFLNAYAHNRGAEYFVMQGHPAGWGDDRFEQFSKIIEFLISQKATFVKAIDLAAPAKIGDAPQTTK